MLLSVGLNAETPVLPYRFLLGLRWELLCAPGLQSKSLLEIVTIITPNDICRGPLIFENPFVPLFPDSPKEETRYNSPEIIENFAGEGVMMPITEGTSDVSTGLIVSLASETDFLPKKGGQRTGLKEMLLCFFIFPTIRTYRRAMELPFAEIFPS